MSLLLRLYGDGITAPVDAPALKAAFPVLWLRPVGFGPTVPPHSPGEFAAWAAMKSEQRALDNGGRSGVRSVMIQPEHGRTE